MINKICHFKSSIHLLFAIHTQKITQYEIERATKIFTNLPRLSLRPRLFRPKRAQKLVGQTLYFLAHFRRFTFFRVNGTLDSVTKIVCQLSISPRHTTWSKIFFPIAVCSFLKLLRYVWFRYALLLLRFCPRHFLTLNLIIHICTVHSNEKLDCRLTTVEQKLVRKCMI